MGRSEHAQASEAGRKKPPMPAMMKLYLIQDPAMATATERLVAQAVDDAKAGGLTPMETLCLKAYHTERLARQAQGDGEGESAANTPGPAPNE